MPTLLERMASKGFTVSAHGIPPVLRVEPDALLSDTQRRTIAGNLDELMADTVFPPISEADLAHIAALLHAGPAAGGMF